MLWRGKVNHLYSLYNEKQAEVSGLNIGQHQLKFQFIQLEVLWRSLTIEPQTYQIWNFYKRISSGGEEESQL